MNERDGPRVLRRWVAENDAPPQQAPPPMPPPLPPPRSSTPGSSALSPSPNGSSISVADFRFLRHLGRGSFGTVTLAEHTRSGRMLAIKTLSKRSVVGHSKALEHAMNERVVLASLSCSFAVKLYFAFQDSKNLYLAMEYVPGGTLLQLLRDHGTLSERRCKFYSSQIVLALEYLHARSMVHRDLKPENILLDQDGYLKVTDFGLAKMVPERTWSFCGTPEYTAPEIIAKQGYDVAVDWWSLGVLIFQCVTGKLPFSHHSRTPRQQGGHISLYDNIQHQEVKFPRHLSGDLVHLLHGLLQKDPLMRAQFVVPIQTHDWFASIDFWAIRQRTVPAPFVPNVPKDMPVSCTPVKQHKGGAVVVEASLPRRNRAALRPRQHARYAET